VFVLTKQFDPTEVSSGHEKTQNLAIFSKLDKEPLAKRTKSGGDEVLNVRKAVKIASQGKGSAALVRQSEGGKGKKRGKR
jgi:regulator of ribosome biosynthesis